MEIVSLNMQGSKEVNGFFIRVLPDEALMLIESLAAQMRKMDPNSERAEFYANDGTYFTIGVHQKLPSNPLEK